MAESPRVTMKDIAARAKVSTMTVSIVLRGKSSNVVVSEATRERVQTLAKEMGYRPNYAARALVTGRTNAIEFWVPNVSNPHFNAVFHQTRRELKRYDLTTLLLETGGRTAADPPAPWTADGLLLCDWAGAAQALHERL